MYLPIAVQKQPQINAAVSEIVKELYPAVQRVRYEIAPDWEGQWAIFFHVLLSDEASNRQNLREIVPRIMWSMTDKLNIPEIGMFPYFHFRSQSEQTQLPEPAWA